MHGAGEDVLEILEGGAAKIGALPRNAWSEISTGSASRTGQKGEDVVEGRGVSPGDRSARLAQDRVEDGVPLDGEGRLRGLEGAQDPPAGHPHARGRIREPEQKGPPRRAQSGFP